MMMNPSEAQLDMACFHSDLYKEVYGIRPRWKQAEDHTVEEWQARINRLLEEGAEDARREREEATTHARIVAEVTACEPLRVPMAAFMVR
jgi:hypothetical protein